MGRQVERVADYFWNMNEHDQIAEFNDYLNFFRKEYIPKQYNQLHTLDYLTDDSVDYLFTVSNRTDGKSVNYKGFAMAAAYRFGMPFMLLSRHWSLRSTIIAELYEYADTLGIFNMDDMRDESMGEYACVYYKDELICIVAELDNSSDLRYSSYALKNCTWIIYDEFLTLNADYVSNEALQFFLIYTSIDRKYAKGKIPLFHYLKVICLGNPTNLNSPLLQALHVTRNFQRQEINTLRQYGNVVLEKLRNDNSKDNANARAVPSDIMEGFYTGDFEFNEDQIVTDDYYANFLQKPVDRFTIKLKEGYLNIQYVIGSFKDIIIEHTMTEKSYTYCTELYDLKQSVQYLDSERFCDLDFWRHYELGEFLFTDEIAREAVLKDSFIVTLDLYRIIALYDETYHKLTNPTAKDQLLACEQRMHQFNQTKEFAKQFGENWIKGAICHESLL